MAKKIKQEETLFPIIAIDSSTEVLVSANADLTMAFELTHPEVFTASDGEIDILSEAYVNAIKTLPTGYIVHKQDWYIEAEYKSDYNNPTIKNGNYLAHANEKHFGERPHIKHKCYIYVTKPAMDAKTRSSKNSSLLKRHLVPKEVLQESTWDSFMDSCAQFEYLLNGSYKIKATRLKPADLLGEGDKTGLFDNYRNLSYDDRSLLETETSNDGSLKIGNKPAYMYVISELNDFPPTVTNSLTYAPYSSDRYKIPVSTGAVLGIGLPYNHIFNQVIVIEDRGEITKKLVKEVKRHNSFSEWEKGNQVSMAYKDDFLLEMEKSGRIAVKSHFNVLVWANDKETAEAYKSTTASSIANLGFTPRQAKHDISTIYWSCIPGNIGEIGIDNLMTTFVDEAVSLFSMETNYNDAGYSPSGIRMTDRFGYPLMVDLFDEPMKNGAIANRNTFIVGPSGSGKSFFTNNMVYYMLAAGMHVSIVDVGHSYKKLCDTVGGRYITYTQDDPIAFNPFFFKTLNPSEEDEDALSELLLSLWKSDNEKVTNAELTTIRDIVHSYYVYLRNSRLEKKNYYPCFDSFYDYAKVEFPTVFKKNGGRQEVEFDLTNFLYVLKPYYGDGQYGFLLNSKKNVDLMDLPFVIYELDNIKDHPVLFPVTTIMIMNTYVRKLFNVEGSIKEGTIKALIIEEAWKALTKEKFANFLRWASKTVRKHDGSLIVVTQELDDLVGSEVVKDAIINNSDIKILLDQKNYENRFSEIESLLGLSAKQSAIVQSVNRSIDHKRPPYREVCILLKDYAKVYGIEVSPTAYAAFTTKKTEVEQIKRLASENYHGDMVRATTAWANGERPRKQLA